MTKHLLLASITALIFINPLLAAEPQLLEKLIDELGDEQHTVRQSATERLIAIGAPALVQLQAAQSACDPEVRWRAALAAERIEHRLTSKQWEGRWKTSAGDWIEFAGERWSSGTPTLGPYRGSFRFRGQTEGVARVDLFVDEGPSKGKTVKLILRLEGNRLLYCGSYGDRPTRFVTQSGWVVYDFAREKGGDP